MAFIGDRQQGWFQELVDAGVVPADTVRMVVDIGLDDAVRVYYETYADPALFNVNLLDRGDVVAIGPRTHKAPPPPPPPPANGTTTKGRMPE